MDKETKKAIQIIVDSSISSFAEGIKSRFTEEVDDPKGVINQKKNNCFISVLGEEFMFYSAFVRSFDSSFGNVLEKLGNNIAKLFYEVNDSIDSFILPEQEQLISSLMSSYSKRTKPEREHYTKNTYIIPDNVSSFKKTHQTDNYFFDCQTKTHYVIELKAGGDLDIKKARAEKIAMLTEYFLLKNAIKEDEKLEIYFATAYNRFGEDNEWKQERVRQFFAEDELLIGKDYWNFVCKDEDGFDVVFEQIHTSVEEVKTIFISEIIYKLG